MLAPIHRLMSRRGHRSGSFCRWRLLLCVTCMATEASHHSSATTFHKADTTAEPW